MDNKHEMHIQPDTVETDDVLNKEVSADEVNQHDYSHHHSHHHSHHSHHHSHRSHRSHHRHTSAKKKDNKFTAFCKKNKHTLINIVACLTAGLLILQFAIGSDRRHSATEQEDDHLLTTESTVQVEASVYLDEISLVNPAIEEYLNLDSDTTTTAQKIWERYNGNLYRLDQEIPVPYKYRVRGLPSGTSVETVYLEVADNQEMTEAQIYEAADTMGEITLYHLLPDETYYYRLNITLSGGANLGTTGSFKTAVAPRLLAIDGLANVRDIGGWKTTDGKRIRYGLLYRGSELDGAVEPKYCLTDDSLTDMLSNLGIRYDLDLRPESVKTDEKYPLGAGVRHAYYGAPAYAEIFKDYGKEPIRAIFSDLANEDHYPMYLHCTYGRDRTGTVCYLLEALLGVSEEDLVRDYELSAFSDGHLEVGLFSSFQTQLQMLEGDTLQEKVEGYLLSIGVTKEEIADIRNIFLETP